MDHQEKLRNFVVNEFKRHYCIRFKAKQLNSVECHCGGKREHHAQDRSSNSQQTADELPWSVQTDIEEAVTDAYGDISFSNGNIGKFVRVSNQTEESKLLELMIEHWKMTNPKLLISVTGGALNFRISPELKKVFNDGLIKAASTTDAWIVTGGMRAGVMKHVGEAVRDYTLKHGSKKPIVSIGIATWGCICSNRTLVNAKGSWPVDYKEETNAPIGESFLDWNHSNFILVDDGTTHKFGVEINLRAQLEKLIALKKTSDDSSVSIPRVVVVLEGGPNTLKTVISSMESGSPVIVVEGSGRVADLLSFAYNNSEPLEIEAKDSSGTLHTKNVSFYGETFEENLEAEIKRIFPKDNVGQTKEKIMSCIDNRDFLTIFNLDGNSSDIDIVILKSLIKTKKKKVPTATLR